MPWLKDDPILKFLANGRDAELQDFLLWQDPATGRKWWGWKKLKTDGMSDPWWAWSILRLTPFTGKGRSAWILHDAAYSKAMDATPWASLVSPARADADRMGRMAALDDGLDSARAWVAYIVLRIGGWYAWMQHGKENSCRNRRKARK